MKKRSKNRSIGLSEELNKAINLHQNGDFQQAKRIYKKIIRHSPRHPEAFHMLGILYSQTGNLDKAIDLMRKSIKAAPGRPDYLFNLAKTYHDRGDLDHAVDTYQENLRLAPDDPEALYRLGRVLQDKQDLAQAIIYYKRALESCPERIDYLNSMGLVYHDHGEYEQAVIYYNQALKNKPDDFVVLKNLGDTFRKLKKFAEASSCFRQALTVKPDYIEAFENLNATLMESGKHEEAAENLLNQGDLYNKLGRSEEALASYNQVLAIIPELFEAHNNLGGALYKLGRIEEAANCYVKALAIKPELPGALRNLGMIRRAQGMVAEAVACFKGALSYKPDYPNVEIYLAIIAWVNGDLLACQNYIDHISSTTEKLSGNELKFVTAYRNFLGRLLKYRESNATRYVKDNNLPSIYVVGDSHCLSVANTTVNFKGVDYLAEAKLVPGCKAWHLGNKDKNIYKYEFNKTMASIPSGAITILMFGEIDCRLEEGIIKHYKKSNVNLAESIVDLVDNYFNYILRVVKDRGIVPIICNVPIQLLGQDVVSEPDKNLLKKVLEIFNRSLADNAGRKQIPLLDIYTFSKTHGGETDIGCHIDNHHLKPSVIGHLIKEL